MPGPTSQFPTCCAQYPGGPNGCTCRFFSVRATFLVFSASRRPHLHFRGLLRLHSHYGPSDCSTAQGGLCHEASTGQLPIRVARQLPDLSTTIWVEPSSTGKTRHRGARESWANMDNPSISIRA